MLCILVCDREKVGDMERGGKVTIALGAFATFITQEGTAGRQLADCLFACVHVYMSG